MNLKTYDKAELKALKETYFTAKALYETVRETAEEIKKEILITCPFYAEREKLKVLERRGYCEQRILKPFDSYLMSDDDFNKFLDLCYAEYCKAGINDERGREYCPEAKSNDLYREAEKMLVEFAIDIIPDELQTVKEKLKQAVKNVKWRDKVLELVLRLED